MVYIFLADGFEEIEALTPYDALKRADIEVNLVGIEKLNITGAHGIKVTADISQDEVDFSDMSAVILPGGMPGTLNLDKSRSVHKAIDYAYQNNLLIAAICAAPSILGKKGLLENKNAVCFPGFENELKGAVLSDKSVVTDKNIITAKGAGVNWEFSFAIISYLKDSGTATKLAETVQCRK
ncbi:MAG: DJ-1 family glyoxalase III [Acutalibacteraceae bacterium]|nr:DJ-1 family glyoxalase III [Acutalibacteraceae bacterium]